MAEYSKTSKERLATCHESLAWLFTVVVQNYDCSILEGYRTPERQAELLAKGKSKVKDGKHNSFPSNAVDVSPYPIPKNWGVGDNLELAKFYHFAGYVKATADSLGVKIRWGGDWNGNNDFSDQTFNDLVHFELVD
ncbi:MAG: M15 family metallopeptidase [Alphaproteobacteria bacterium]